MAMKLWLSDQEPVGSLFLLLCSEHINSRDSSFGLSTEFNTQSAQISLTCDDDDDDARAESLKGLTQSQCIGLYLARTCFNSGLGGDGPLQESEVDHWLNFAFRTLSSNKDSSQALDYLNGQLGLVTFLVGFHLTLADLAVWSSLTALHSSCLSDDKDITKSRVHINRWYKHLAALPIFQLALSKASSLKLGLSINSRGGAKQRKEEGKFVELPGAEKGKVVVRFPPEASGYLHIGHAKAALLNQYYQLAFDGKLIMRFDDTNPAKEDAHFEEVILGDLALLGIRYDMLTHTSDYFSVLLGYCERLLENGLAYVDDTDADRMKREREERVESCNRNNSVERNLQLWSAMLAGTEEGQRCCVRAKIDMQSDNGALRDPTLYRCKVEEHIRTGNKFKAYPTYDFACPIVDSLENVTHALRTTEYHDRDAQYYWLLDSLGLRKPHLWEYSRLNLQHTVLSKRRLTWFVEQGHVSGWDDPRFPTVRGVLRRGMTAEGLKQFIVAQGGSRSVVQMEWDKIWAFNKKVIDPIAPRHTGLLLAETVPLDIIPAIESSVKLVARHPKNSEVGEKEVLYTSNILIEGADAETLKEGEMVTLINWGNATITKIVKDASGRISRIEARLDLENTDFKKTTKLTWLADDLSNVPLECITYDHIISKPVLGKDEDFKHFVNANTRSTSELIGDPGLRLLQKGDIIQLQRRGFFICDHPYEPFDSVISKEIPCRLLFIPDGHVKELPVAGSKHKAEQQTSTKANTSKKANKSANQQKPEPGKSVNRSADESNPVACSDLALRLCEQIHNQGMKVRDLKATKADKSVIDTEVKILLKAKEDFKKETGEVYTPDFAKRSQPVGQPLSSSSLDDRISAQGDKVRRLKSEKADKDTIDREVKLLLELKNELKKETDLNPTHPQTPATGGGKSGTSKKAPEIVDNGINEQSFTPEQIDLSKQIEKQGDLIRQLKLAKAEKDKVGEEVKLLLNLKTQFKSISGITYTPEIAKKCSLCFRFLNEI